MQLPPSTELFIVALMPREVSTNLVNPTIYKLPTGFILALRNVKPDSKDAPASKRRTP